MIGEHPDNKIKSNVIRINNNFNEELSNFFNTLEKKTKIKNKNCTSSKKNKTKKNRFMEKK